LRWILREFPFGDWKTVEVSEADGGTGEPIRQSRSQAVQVAAMLSSCFIKTPIRMVKFWGLNSGYWTGSVRESFGLNRGRVLMR
jgi:hypothetical protein